MQNSRCLKETFDFRLLRFEDPKAKKFETISRHFQAVSPPWMELNKPTKFRTSKGLCFFAPFFEAVNHFLLCMPKA